MPFPKQCVAQALKNIKVVFTSTCHHPNFELLLLYSIFHLFECYQVKSSKHFSQLQRQFCQSQQHWGMLRIMVTALVPVLSLSLCLHCIISYGSVPLHPLQHWDLDALPNVREIFFFIKPWRLQVMSRYHY